MAKDKEKPVMVQRAFHVSLPAKNLVVKLMTDGSVHFDGNTTAYQATHHARALDPKSFEVKAADFVLAAAITSFEDKAASEKK